MKKTTLGIVTLLAIATLAGCNPNSMSMKTLTCTLYEDSSTGTTLNSIYKIKHNGTYVSSLETIETIESDSEERLNSIKNYISELYKPTDNLKYYEYEIILENNTLTTKVTIDYEKIDMNKLNEIDPGMSTSLQDDKVLLKDLKNTYESWGAICE